ncbi:hypothetical protein [Candidatus Poriferisocius sp.]|uniref:hypothetical protein n=1 Tax=Candidatus Poriferisocius sp. TaxID=3101276 RepID=UPI003B58E3B1
MRHQRLGLAAVALVTGLALVAGACSTGNDESGTADPPTEATAAPAPAPPDEAPADETPSDAGEPTEDGAEVEAPAAADDVTEAPAAADPDQPDPEPEPEPEVERTASFRGVTADTIDIGVGFWDTTVFGFGFFGDTEAVWAALTDAVNARGGVNGRSLVPTIAGFNPADNAGMLEACIALTEDAEVFAVLGGMRGDANFCVFEQHETIHLGSQVYVGEEALERARAPIAGFFPSGDGREAAFIAALDDRGWFDDATAVGVHYDGADVEEQLGDAVNGALTAAGVDLDLVLSLDDLGVDADTMEAQIEVMQELARSNNISHMVIIGPAATALITYGDLDMDLAAVDSQNFTTAIMQGIDPAQLDGTVSSALRADSPTDPIDPISQQCLDDVQAALPDARFERPGPGVENSADDPNYWPYTILACRDLELFVQSATAAGVHLTNDSFRVGLESLTNLALPEIPYASYGPGKYNGSDTFRLVLFDADADEDGELVPLGDPIDLTP